MTGACGLCVASFAALGISFFYSCFGLWAPSCTVPFCFKMCFGGAKCSQYKMPWQKNLVDEPLVGFRYLMGNASIPALCFSVVSRFVVKDERVGREIPVPSFWSIVVVLKAQRMAQLWGSAHHFCRWGSGAEHRRQSAASRAYWKFWQERGKILKRI